MDTIRNIEDFAEMLNTTVEGLEKYFSYEVHPVTITYNTKRIKLSTDADRVPFEKTLYFPFTEDDYDEAICGLQCVTDYAMHEGYEHTHKDLYAGIALRYAEAHGIYEYKVNGTYMEYWSMYEDGFYFYRVDLDTEEKAQLCHIEWHKEDGIHVPAFLLTNTGATLYNYFEG